MPVSGSIAYWDNVVGKRIKFAGGLYTTVIVTVNINPSFNIEVLVDYVEKDVYKPPPENPSWVFPWARIYILGGYINGKGYDCSKPGQTLTTCPEAGDTDEFVSYVV